MTRPLKISIVTPSLNQAPFIERTILSILRQDYPHTEYIVIDGGSTDGTIEILKKYGGRLQWISRRDEGQADAINKGIAMATGDIIGYLNSDDVYEPGALRRVAEHFAARPEAMWVTGKCRIIDEQDREVRRAVTAYKNFLLRHYTYSLLLVTNPISQPATFWRRAVVEKFGLFNKNEHLIMDYDYWLRIGKTHPVEVLDGYLAGFRVYSGSKTSRSFLITFRQELELARKYSSSNFLNFLHWFSYLAISLVYFVMNFLPRLKKGS